MEPLTGALVGLFGTLLSSAFAPDAPEAPPPRKPMKDTVQFSGRGRGGGQMARSVMPTAAQSPLYQPDFSPQRSALELMKGVKPNFNPTQTAAANLKKRGGYA